MAEIKYRQVEFDGVDYVPLLGMYIFCKKNPGVIGRSRSHTDNNFERKLDRFCLWHVGSYLALATMVSAAAIGIQAANESLEKIASMF